MELIYEYLDIRAFKTTEFHSSGNGLSERNIKTIKNMIKAYVNEEHGDCDIHLNQFAYAYNSAIKESTEQTFEMILDVNLKSHDVTNMVLKWICYQTIQT